MAVNEDNAMSARGTLRRSALAAGLGVILVPAVAIAVLGDFNGDGQIDQADFAALPGCMGGPGGSLGPGCGEGGTRVGPTIPADEAGRYDTDALTECLREVKSLHPDEDTIILSADPTVPYEDVVAAMDASRSDDDGPLFTEVLLAAGVR